MLSAAAVAFALSAVAFSSERSRALLGLSSAVLSGSAVVVQLGLVPGLVVALALLMTAASGLVLVLSPRPEWARPIATGCSALGVLACVLWAATGGVP